jgi:primosomal protein N' (replication factor Y) (superfamily II helicase)
MAVVRAKIFDVPVVLASATPSLETLGNARAGRYRHLVLPDRHGKAVMPTVMPVDLRRDMPVRGRYLAPSVVEAVREALQREEQAMLFLNRRGYAPLTLCRSCGHRLECPNCTAWLVDHRLSGRLLCHHCGFTSRPVTKCTACEAEDSFVPCGPGVERIAEEVADIFPDARSLVMASDLIHTAGQAAEMIARVQAREVDIVIGTQLVAKGHNFPLLSLVVVVDADIGFEGGDFRAFERTFQLLSQVGGRSGRADTTGTVLLQTRAPDHPVIRALAADDRQAFLEDLLDDRQRHDLPPFTRMAAVIVSGPDVAAVEMVAHGLGRTAPTGNRGVSVVGPAPAPLALLRGRHRRRLLMTADRRAPIQRILEDWISGIDVPSSVRVTIDIDPYSFF